MKKHRLFITSIIAAACGGHVLAASTKWELVRSVPYPGGGTQDFIIVPGERQRDIAYYREAADAVCGSRTTCQVFFWTSRENIPTSPWFEGPAMRTLTGQYERHPNYREPHLRLACWLYSSKEVGEKSDCFYMPGAQVPPSK